MYIDGAYVAPRSGDQIKIINPADESKVGLINIADASLVDQSVSAAVNALNGEWSDISPARRESLLHKLADLIDDEKESIAQVLSTETGKLYAQALSEVGGAVGTFRYYAGWASKLEGETIDISLRQKPGKKNFAFTKIEPVGVVAAIVPWNFPISIASWKLAPALAAGCTVVLKPSEVAPLSTLYLGKLISASGIPKGVINIITGDGSTGKHLTSDPRIDKITFTGSTQVGKIIGKAAMDNMTGLSLELGGKSPAVVFEDADLDEAVKGIAMGIFRNSGQVCVAGSRAYVQRNILDLFVKKICETAENMKISDAFDEAADIGPLVSKEHLDRVKQYIDKGIEEGAKLCTGGNNPESTGYYMQPTVFTTEDNKQTLVQEEVFGPVLVIVPFDTLEDAIKLSNESKYALSSTVWTRDISKALACVHQIDAGWVFVNSVARSDPNFPLGGNKQSGNTRELGKAGVYNYTKTKAVNIVF